MPERVLLFGGSFNPVHRGHVECARAVAVAGGFDRVVLLPAQVSPHKVANSTLAPLDLAPAEDRLAMCRLAVDGEALLDVSDFELRRAGPSYTIETVRALRQSGQNDIHWLIGADQLNALPTWREADRLLIEATLHVIARPGHEFDWASLPPVFRELRNNVITAPLLPISSTDIRRRVRAGLPIADLVPPKVDTYIKSHALYREPAAKDFP